MSDYTPTTEEVSGAYNFWLQQCSDETVEEITKKFDRWLDEVKADAWLEGACSVGESEFPSREWDEGNPYRQVDRVCGACSDDPIEAENACWGCAKAYRQGEEQ